MKTSYQHINNFLLLLLQSFRFILTTHQKEKVNPTRCKSTLMDPYLTLAPRVLRWDQDGPYGILVVTLQKYTFRIKVYNVGHLLHALNYQHFFHSYMRVALVPIYVYILMLHLLLLG